MQCLVMQEAGNVVSWNYVPSAYPAMSGLKREAKIKTILTYKRVTANDT